MLVLSRKTNETIHVGDNTVITIVRIKGNTVRVGIEAPPDVRIRRGEHLQQAGGDAGERQSAACTQEAQEAVHVQSDVAGPNSDE